MSNLMRRTPSIETSPTLPEFFGRLMGFEPAFRAWGPGFWPPMDLEERDNDIRVLAEIPGMDSKGCGSARTTSNRPFDADFGVVNI